MLFPKRILFTFSMQRYFRLMHKFFSSHYRKESVTFKEKIIKGPSLSDFISNKEAKDTNQNYDRPPYLNKSILEKPQKVYIETYGCQMNVSDTEVIYAILEKSGFEITKNLTDTNVVLVMTCAIREGAEQKIWHRLEHFKNLKVEHFSKTRQILKIGVLGCMAERLKYDLLEKDKLVDIVAGPDSYKDLPNLLAIASEGQKAVNVMLSVDETYADIMPVRINQDSKSAFVSIMRGCDNMCTYCIVPFTRGRERSRPTSSILEEVKYLSDQGVREITLLGQNVNSYRDVSESAQLFSNDVRAKIKLSSGFQAVYKDRFGGLRFADLLGKVADVNPEIRIRFTSPHPKDFPDEVLHVISEKCNVCKLLHLPAQSGNSEVLERMRRGYTREAYLDLVEHIRKIIPGVAFTSDFICGFCEETEEEHRDTLSLLEKVKYEFAYVFPYSMRAKTRAYHKLNDNVPEDVKKRRADEVYNLFRDYALQLHKKEIGNYHLVQVLGPSKRSDLDWSGRNDWNTKVIYPQSEIPDRPGSTTTKLPSPGDYVVVEITGCTSQVLKGRALHHTTLEEFEKFKNNLLSCKEN